MTQPFMTLTWLYLHNYITMIMIHYDTDLLLPSGTHACTSTYL